jgi:hypothetical protein
MEISVIPIDAVLVIDVSRSMRTADPDEISRRAMNFFTEKLTENRDRVGVVAYAGKIESSLDLHKINSENLEKIKHFIDELNYASWTDHGFGLLEAMNFFADTDETRQGIIIFLTDGNMNVNPAGERTNEIAQNDVNAAILSAREKNIPIHTIGLNFDGNLASEYIENISRATRGLFFETACALDIPQIIDAFFCELIAAPVLEIPETEPETQISKTKSFPAREKKEISVPPRNFSSETVAGIFLFLAILTLLILKFQSPRRVFTGKLEIIEKNKKTVLNLIEYGSRAKILDEIILTPSPTAPSYLPQLRIKTKNPKIKFKKDFIDVDSNEISLGAGTECIVEIDGKQIILRYVM